MIHDNFFDQQEFVPFLDSHDDTHIHGLFPWRDIWRKENHADFTPVKCSGMTRSIIIKDQHIKPYALCVSAHEAWIPHQTICWMLVHQSKPSFAESTELAKNFLKCMQVPSIPLPIIAIGAMVALQQTTKVTLSFAFFLPRTIEKHLRLARELYNEKEAKRINQFHPCCKHKKDRADR